MAFLSDHEMATLWDVVSARRVEAERIAAASRPADNFSTDYMEISGAWTWLPAGCLDSAQSWPTLASKQAIVDRSSWLNEAPGRGRCGIDAAGELKAGQPPLKRAVHLLGAAFEAWSSFAASVQWSETRVVLFPPEGVEGNAWLDAVMSQWPDALGVHSVVVASANVEDWFDRCLSNASGAQRLLLLSIDSRLSRWGGATVCAGHVSGECITALHLQRVESGPAEAAGGWRLYPAQRTEHESRDLQLPTDTTDIARVVQSLEEVSGICAEQMMGVVTDGATTDRRLTQLTMFMTTSLEPHPPIERMVGVAALAGGLGHTATLLTQLAVAYLLAIEHAKGAVLVLDRYRGDVTAGWLLAR
nr:hypothetical protein [uncultured Pseudomonas sp.]